MKKASIVLTLLAVFSMALLSACTVPGPGSIVTEEKNFSNFARVKVEGTFDVDIVQSDSFSVIIRADSSFFDYVNVSQEGDTLIIALSPHHTFTDFTQQARTLKAEITMPALYSLNVAGASKANISGFEATNGLVINISGASSLNLNEMLVQDLNGEVSGASKITGSVNATDTRLEVSGASKIELDGMAKSIILDASGASKVDLADFPLDDALIDLSGASEATVNVKGRLDCRLSAASRLYFQGNPVMGDIEVSGASTIKHR